MAGFLELQMGVNNHFLVNYLKKSKSLFWYFKGKDIFEGIDFRKIMRNEIFFEEIQLKSKKKRSNLWINNHQKSIGYFEIINEYFKTNESLIRKAGATLEIIVKYFKTRCCGTHLRSRNMGVFLLENLATFLQIPGS